MAFTSLETEQSLDLLLNILPDIKHIGSFSNAKVDKATFRNVISRFEIAAYELCARLKDLGRTTAVTDGAQVIYRAVVCLEKIASPGVSTQETPDLYPNLKAVGNLQNSIRTRFFYDQLKIRPKIREEVLKTLRSCVDELPKLVAYDAERLQPPADIIASDFDNIWTNTNNVYNAIVACGCGTSHGQEINEMKLELGLATNPKEAKHSDYYNCYGLHVLIPANNSLRHEVKFLVSEEQKKVSTATSNSNTEISCSYRSWMMNPKPDYLRTNFKLEGNRLWRLNPNERKFIAEAHGEQITLEELIWSNSAEWKLLVKFILAATLAHSLLYLNGGPWLRGSWSRSKIVFYKDQTSIWARPFLQTQISTAVGDQPDINNDPPIHQYPGNLEFGVALLEIYLGKRIIEPSIDTLWATACKILKQQTQDMHDCYRSAVTACLKPGFGFETDFEPQQFRKRIFESIVTPLNRVLRDSFGSSVELNSIDEAATMSDLVTGIYQNRLNKTHSSRDCAREIQTQHSHRKLKAAPIAFATSDIIPKESECSPLLSEIPKSKAASFDGDMNMSREMPDQIPLKSDRWMLRFKKLHSKLKTNSTRNINSRIKVAILDSGIDLENTDIDAQSDQIKDIRSWVDDKSGLKVHDGDSSGHGTHIAGIILDLAPNVDIYIAKVTKFRELENISQILEAFQYSCDDWNVDIITMSFGFSKGCDKLWEAIRAAESAGKIVFAAASNNGKSSSRTFPAKYEKVICIHSTDYYGNSSKFNPSPVRNTDNFMILGEDISSCWPDPTQAGASKRMTGTSFAVPVAVALAAILIEYVEQEFPDLTAGGYFKIRGYEGITRLFRYLAKINREGDTGEKYDLIAPFKFLDGFDDYQGNIKHVLTPGHNILYI